VLLIYSYTFKYYLLYILLLIYGAAQGEHPGGHSNPRYSEHPAPQSHHTVSNGGAVVVVVVVGSSVVVVVVDVDVVVPQVCTKS
jgi:hypothetical protein